MVLAMLIGLAIVVVVLYCAIDVLRSWRVTRAIRRCDSTLDALLDGKDRATYRLTKASMPFDVVAAAAATRGWSVDGLEGDSVVLVRDAD